MTVVRNVYWEVRLGLALPAGEYTVIASSPATWAQNAGSRGFGQVVIKGD